MMINLIQILCLSLFCINLQSLQHAKSFIVQDDINSLSGLALYQNSMLLNALNDIIEKDIETGEVRRIFRGHTSTVTAFTIFKQNFMVTAGLDLQLILWDLVSGSIIKRVALGADGASVQAVAAVGDTAFVGTFFARILKIDLITGQVVRNINANGAVNSLFATADFLFVGAQTPPQAVKLNLGDLRRAETFDRHLGWVFQIVVHENVAYTCSSDRSIMSWNPRNGGLIRSFLRHEDWVTSIALEGTFLYSADDFGVMYKWNANSGSTILKFLTVPDITIQSLVVKSGILYTTISSLSVVKWNTNTGQEILSYPGRTRALVALNWWNGYIIGAGKDTPVQLWDTNSVSTSASFTLADTTTIISDLLIEKNLLYAATGPVVKEWDLELIALIKSFVEPTGDVTCLVAAEGSLYAGTQDGVFRQWNISSGLISHNYTAHSRRMTSFYYYSDILLSASLDLYIFYWNTREHTKLKEIYVILTIRSMLVLDSVVYTCGPETSTFDFETGELKHRFRASATCNDFVIRDLDLIVALSDFSIQLLNRESLEPYSSLRDGAAVALCLDSNNVLYSAGDGGNIKRWNFEQRTVSFSFEDLKSSVSSLGVSGNALFVAQRDGLLRTFDINTGYFASARKLHENTITYVFIEDNSFLTVGRDGFAARHFFDTTRTMFTFYNDSSSPLLAAFLFSGTFYIIRNENEVLLFNKTENFKLVDTILSTIPLTSITATDSFVFLGTRSGRIIGWDSKTLLSIFDVTRQTATISFLLAQNEILYSASDDKTIVQWSIKSSSALQTFARSSDLTLGHVGPVNSLALCNSVLFSGGSDLTVRRWNTASGRHEDVYFGHAKKVSAVLCYNGSLFSGSDDFSVLQYNPSFPAQIKSSELLSRGPGTGNPRALTRSRGQLDMSGASVAATNTYIFVGSLLGLIILIATFIVIRRRKNAKDEALKESALPSDVSTTDFSTIITDLKTLVPTSMGLSLHAQLEINPVYVVQLEYLTAGGGGSLYKAKLMEPSLAAAHGDIVIQKVFREDGKLAKYAFDQEVAIMIMLSSEPHFCKLVGYTSQPLSMILRLYKHGSLNSWIPKSKYDTDIACKILKEICRAIYTMHSHFLAHCDLKTQNVLVDFVDGKPSCFLTDFGITQILSDQVLAAKTFYVLNLRGLSVGFAAPEAFNNFRKKDYRKVDFKKYDMYSLGCVIKEVLTRKAPWS